MTFEGTGTSRRRERLQMANDEALRREVARLEREHTLYKSLAQLKRVQADRTEAIVSEIGERLREARAILGSRMTTSSLAGGAPRDENTAVVFQGSEPLAIGLRDD